MNQNGSVVLKRFIRYLYEYEQEKRMRNVGFVKSRMKSSVRFTYTAKGCLTGMKRSLHFIVSIYRMDNVSEYSLERLYVPDQR